MVDQAIRTRILDLLPQKPPFRFIDSILEIDGDRIVGDYRFREDEYFYQGHFPGNPVTPGVILIEAMAQTGVVALGLWLMLKQGITETELKEITTLFALVDQVEFSGIVRPGERVIIHGEKLHFRKSVLKVNAAIRRENGDRVCCGILSGKGVIQHET